jgi:hypothetical protein
MTTTMPFVCAICEEQSTRICVECTKDTCANHLCEKCGACSDCCDCEVRLDEEPESRLDPTRTADDMSSGPRDTEPHPHPHPMPDPDPAPDPEPIPTFPSESDAR